MASIIYIGDEVTAAGYRLAGVETLMPSETEAVDTIQRALTGEAELVMLSAELASLIPEQQAHRMLRSERPLVTIVADVYERFRPTPLEPEVRKALGIES
jgi:vacuolar-type H+-ATPase subunit F/Vma7